MIEKGFGKSKKRMYVILRRFIILVLLLLLFVQTPTAQWLKSVGVMRVYSTYEASKSVLSDKNIKVKIPGGLGTVDNDWYPFVMTFNDDRGFSRYIDEEARMTVLYNFGHFSPWSYQSIYYDRESPYYNSFYGAYAVSVDREEPFGYVNGEQKIEEIVQVPTYDMLGLVLEDFGAVDPVFQFEVIEQGKRVLFDNEQWFYVDADLMVTGCLHEYKKDYQAYIQYGRPPKMDNGIMDFEPVKMYGRIYGKYLEDKEVTLFFYCIASDAEVIKEWEDNQMAQTELTY